MRRYRRLVSCSLCLILALVTYTELAVAAGSGDVPACQIGAWSTDEDPNGLNIRAVPGADGAIIGNIPPPTELEGDPFASEVSITGSQDGWFRISSAYFTDYYSDEQDQVFFEGEGWVFGRYLGLEIEGRHLYAEPSRDAAVVIELWSPDSAEPHPFVLERLHACQGYWVEVEGTLADERIRGWTDDTCSSQVTTCP